ncbi:MAG: LysR family transcriptional regulator [Pseudomonadota bacterium]
MDTSKVDLNLLLALDALLAEQNVTKAARRLRISQPTLSARLARLRDMFGDPLLTPTQRGMTPTARALELKEPLHRALEQVRAVVAANAPFDPAKADLTVALASADYVQETIFAPLALRLMEVAPRMRLVARQLNRADLGAQLERGEVDMAFLVQSPGAAAQRHRRLFDERFVVALRSDHPAAGAPMDLDRFCDLDHVVVSPQDGALRTLVDAQLLALGRARRVRMAVSNFLVALEIVARSDLVMLAPERLARSRRAALSLRAPPFAVEGFSMHLAWHDRTTDHPAYAWVREQIVEICDPGGAPNESPARR